ncbi:hypothetical protein AG0111_0g4687 [Alternaria gaisen]|uniref:Uncharacterized protein n=1 Tax=Alternaria gaisen TaxID=167740 RepID=A0ACB6FRU8_9PLEO|nr:hypothetical protein AG0111_0g4687 [Alternaria gaisen]
MSTLPTYRGQFPLDDFQPGYPKFAALLDVHPAFQNFRRFTRARLRLLLLKQDEIATLETSLDFADENEPRKLFLSCARRDENPKRVEMLKKLQVSLSEYDTMMRDYHHAMRLPAASPRDITSIQNYLDGTGSIAIEESAFLSHRHDLANLTGALDSAATSIEYLIERAACRLSYPIRKLAFLPEALKPGRGDLTQDPNIFFAGPRLRSFSRAVTSWVAAAILLAPVIVLFCIQDALWRLITITVAVLFFLSALSTWTKARTIEVVTAGARYVPQFLKNMDC